MTIKKFDYKSDRGLKALKTICKQTGSTALKKTFEYLRILFYFTPPEKVFAEFIPNIAYCIATVSKNHVRLVDIGVVENHQHKGIGKLLLTRLLAHARHLRINKITLRTSSEETAFMFYQKLGFHVVGMKDNDLEMEKML